MKRGTRESLEELLRQRGWKKVSSPAGFPEHAWGKPPLASTGCSETSLLGAVRRQLELEDDFGVADWR